MFVNNFAITGLSILAKLTPGQRYQALRDLTPPSPLTDRRFVIGGLIIIGILITLLFIVHYWQKIVQARSAKSWFLNFSKRHSLTWAEQKLLRNICRNAHLTQIDAIFTMPEVFDKGVSELLTEKSLDKHTDIEKLQASIIILRAKMDYDVQNSVTGATQLSGAITSTQQIPVGAQIRLTRRKNAGSKWIEAIIKASSDGELTLQLPINLGQISGGVWILQYDYGPMVLEFTAPVLKSEPGELSIGHTEDIRAVSRRRFVRVPFRSPAFIALYQFDLGSEFDVPRFYKAMLTQIAGPGLLLESKMELAVGQRVLVLTGLPQGKFVQDIAMVRHVRKIEGGYSVAVEIIGAKEAEFDELVKATLVAQENNEKTNEKTTVAGKI